MGLNRSKWVANYLKEKEYETRSGVLSLAELILNQQIQLI
jgi:hypothetical protein